MTEFVSDVKTILHNAADVYRVLSDPRKLEQVKEMEEAQRKQHNQG